MENKPLKFNKPFTSDQVIAENSLQSNLEHADPISKNIAEAEIGVHRYQMEAQALKALLVQESFSPEVVTSIQHWVDLVEEKLTAYEKRKKLIRLKQETQVIQEPLDEGDEWKQGTEYSPTYEEIQVYALAKPGVKESTLDKLEDDLKRTTTDIKYTYDHIKEFFPEAFAKIEQAFNDMQKENRTN